MYDSDWKIISKLHKEKNITRTADLVFMTQPTLSKRIQRIEDELGVHIIERSTKGVAFTPDGEYLAQRAEEFLETFEEIKKHLSASHGGRQHVLSIGAPNSYCRLVLPHLMKNYTDSHPDLHFDISTGRSDEILKMVENGSIDVGFVRGELTSSLEQLLVSLDQVYLVSQKAINMTELPSKPQIDFVKEPTIIALTERWWNEHFDKPPFVLMRVNNADICKAMIMAGLGYGIFPDIDYTRESDHLNTLALTYKDGSRFTRRTRLFYHKESAEDPVVKDFIDFVRASNIRSFVAL